MAKKNQQAKSSTASTKPPIPAVGAKLHPTALFRLPWWTAYVIIFLFSILLYSNTLWNYYAMDDSTVLTDNRFSKKGLAGLKDHFTHDMFEGSFGEGRALYLSGGRYRPLSMASLTLEYELMRRIRHDKRDVITDKNVIVEGQPDPYLAPMLSHAINILLFGLSCMLLYYLLQEIIPKKYSFKSPLSSLGIEIEYLGVPFLTALLFAAHPIHTEAVANIKGRDEVLCLLFSLLALLAAVKYVKTQHITHLVWGMLIYFVALLSKENAITLFAVIPLTYFFFTKAKAKDYVITLSLYIIPAVVFLYLRSKYTQVGLTQESPEVLNNPLLFATGQQHYATLALTFFYYFKLLVFPHPLTHDYFYNQIPYVDFNDLKVIFSIVINAALLVYAVLNIKKKSIASYAILFYFITFSIASNVFFTVGVLMSERFIYISSLGFCMLFAYLFVQAKDRFKLSPLAILSVFVVILSLYSFKTYSRNYDWKDSFTLFRRDINNSPNSAKLQTSLGEDLIKASDSDIRALRDSGMIKSFLRDLSGGSKTDDALTALAQEPDSAVRRMLLDSAIAHLYEAVSIYPTYSTAYLYLGNALYKRDHKGEEVIPIYKKAVASRAGVYYEASLNLAVAYNDVNQPDSARISLLRAYQADPKAIEPGYLLAHVYAELNQPDSVDYWLQKAGKLKPPNAEDYYLIGADFVKEGHDLPMAIVYFKKAIELNPKAELYYRELAAVYGLNSEYNNAIATSQKAIELNPRYAPAYMIMSIAYRNKGNTTLADECKARYEELTGAGRK